MSLSTVDSPPRDRESLSNTKTLTLSKGGSLVIKKVRHSPGDTDASNLYEMFVSDERDLYIRDCLTRSVTDYLNRIGTASDRRNATGSPSWIGKPASLRAHIMLGVLFLQDPQPEEQLRVMYTPNTCRDPYSVQLRRLTGMSCLGYVKAIV